MSLARRQPTTVLAPDQGPPTEVYQASTPTVFSFQEMIEMAEFFAAGKLVKGVETPQQAFTLMMVCQAQGLHPGHIVTRYHVIEGAPSMRSDVMLAEFQAGGGRVEWIKSDDEAVEAVFTHPFHPKPFIVKFTLAQLVESETAMAWNSKVGKLLLKANYRKSPAAMLRARAITAGIRAVNPGALHGIHAPEEIGSITTTPHDDNAPPPALDNSTSARPIASTPPPAVLPPPPAVETTRLVTQEGDHDARSYTEVVKQEAEALTVELQKLDPAAKPVERFQLHRHILKAGAAAGLTEAIAPGTKVSNALVTERCQDLYRSDREWVRAEIAAYTDRLWKAAAAEAEGSQATAENESQAQGEPGESA